MFFEKTFCMLYRDSDRKGNIRLDCLLLYLQEAAILHSIQVGFDETYMKKNNSAWVLNKLSLELMKPVEIREKITIKTWSREIKSFKATREFEIYNSKEECIGKASSLWFFIDSKDKKIKRIPLEVKNFYGEVPYSTGIVLKEIDPNLENNGETFRKSYTLRQSDIDSNGHLNNTVYAQFLEDIVGNIADNLFITSFNIIYKKEVPYEGGNIFCEVRKNSYLSNYYQLQFKICCGENLSAYGEANAVPL